MSISLNQDGYRHALALIEIMAGQTGADVPNRILLFRRGENVFRWESGKEVRAVLDEAGIASILAEFQRLGADLLIDYEHQSRLARENGQPAPAAGWIKSLEADEQGLWANVEWTARAKEFLGRKEYRYLSPVFWTDKQMRIVKLGPGAITNTPATVDAKPIVSRADAITRNQEGEMDKIIAELRKLLGFKEGAGEDEVLASMSALGPALALVGKVREKLSLKPEDDVVAAAANWQPQAKEAVPKEVIDTLGLAATATTREVVAAIAAMKPAADAVQAMRQELDGLKGKLAARETEELVGQALKEGKVTPAQKEWAAAYAARDPEGFKTFLAKAPVIVKPGQIDIKTDPAGKAGIDPVQASINAQLGVGDEAFLKHNPVSQEG